MTFTRRNYSNLQTKAQVLTQMVDNPKIHPLLAFQSCGMFVDPEAAFKMSDTYYEEQRKLDAQYITDEGGDGDAGYVRTGRQNAHPTD